ncbi:peptidase [Streptomyces sp. cmx-18-6]|uniref:peptidase n=1 Tax=Streptomyces sp. cmx-18-6 TaxID=2790930 RepID=UPI00398186DA
MKIRRILATAVAAAVTTPAVMLSVTPAFADTKPSAQTQDKPTQNEQAQNEQAQDRQVQDRQAQNEQVQDRPAQGKQAQGKPTVKELEKAAAEAQKAYDAAVTAKETARTAQQAAESDTAPLTVAAKAAQKAAEDAAAAKTTADQAVTDAQAVLDDLPETATDEKKAAAAKTLSEARATAATAATAKDTADTAARTAAGLASDARIAAARDLDQATKALEAASAAKTAADEALARAKKEEDQGDRKCPPEPGLTTVVSGFPSTVAAGTSTTFSVRVSNGTDKDMEQVLTYASATAFDTDTFEDITEFLRLKWSTEASPKWKNVDGDLYVDAIGALKRGEKADVKLRLDVDAAAPAGQGLTLIAGDYFNEDGCGITPEAAVNGFDIKAAAKPSKPKPTPTPVPSTPGNSVVTPQSSGSGIPANTTNGTLAATGSSDATSQMALTSGAAVLLGTGAMFLARRRRAGSDA